MKLNKTLQSYICLVELLPPYIDSLPDIFETKIYSNFRCCHGYPNCGKEINRIKWV